MTNQDIKTQIDNNASIQEALLSTIQTIVLKLERKLSDLELQVKKIHSDIQTRNPFDNPPKVEAAPKFLSKPPSRLLSNSPTKCPSWKKPPEKFLNADLQTNSPSCRCRCHLFKDEVLSNFSKHFSQLREDLYTKGRSDSGDVSTDKRLARQTASNASLLEMIQESSSHVITEVLKGLDMKAEFATNILQTAICEQTVFCRNQIKDVIQESRIEFQVLLSNKQDEAENFNFLRNQITKTLDSIQNEAQRLRCLRESFNSDLDGRLAWPGGGGVGGCGCGRIARPSAPPQLEVDDRLVDRLHDLHNKIHQLPNINQVIVELIENFKEIRDLAGDEDTDASVSRGPAVRYKKRSDFRSDRAYSDYISTTVTAGMKVRYTVTDDPTVARGDQGVVEEVDVGHITVDWEGAGLVGSPCEDVEIIM